MSGEKDLEVLLRTMSPTMSAEEYVFASFEHASYGDHQELEPFASIQEQEGLTLVVSKANADEHGVPYVSVYKAITLQVHSSLDAVGLTAAISEKLTEHQISANVIAGYFHDHVFVQSEYAETAKSLLSEFGEAGTKTSS